MCVYQDAGIAFAHDMQLLPCRFAAVCHHCEHVVVSRIPVLVLLRFAKHLLLADCQILQLHIKLMAWLERVRPDISLNSLWAAAALEHAVLHHKVHLVHAILLACFACGLCTVILQPLKLQKSSAVIYAQLVSFHT